MVVREKYKATIVHTVIIILTSYFLGNARWRNERRWRSLDFKVLFKGCLRHPLEHVTFSMHRGRRWRTGTSVDNTTFIRMEHGHIGVLLKNLVEDLTLRGVLRRDGGVLHPLVRLQGARDLRPHLLRSLASCYYARPELKMMGTRCWLEEAAVTE
jgi:hypothetical protein